MNNESQDFITDKFHGDNSFYIPRQDTISLGSGGVDDAEDAEVTWHEYGHAIQDDQVPRFGTSNPMRLDRGRVRRLLGVHHVPAG